MFLSDVKGKNWLRSVTYALTSFASSSRNDFTPKEARGPATCRKNGPPTSSAVAQWVSDTDGMLFSRTKPISPFEIKVRQQPKARNSRSTASVIAAMMVALERRLTFPCVRAALQNANQFVQSISRPVRLTGLPNSPAIRGRRTRELQGVFAVLGKREGECA